MENTKTSFSIALRALGVLLTLATTSLFAQTSDRPADMLGLALVGHPVADLERSIKFFEAVDFKVVEGPTAWTVDKELNKLGNTPGAESRTATMQVQSSVSDVPFTLVLRQYRGIDARTGANCRPGTCLPAISILRLTAASARCSTSWKP